MKTINISLFPPEDPRPIEHQLAKVAIVSLVGAVATIVSGRLYDKMIWRNGGNA
jgi:hypothetical protein